MAPIIVPKLATSAKCAVTVCESFLLGISKKGPPGVSKVKYVPDKEGMLALDKFEVGDFVSTYQLVVRTSRRLTSGYGRERCQDRFHGGTIYNDAASVVIWVENQVSLGENETLLGKSRFDS